MSFVHRTRLFLWIAVGVFALQGIGTVIAIVYRLPYEVGGVGDPNTVARDFLLGGGTALSGPLVVQAVLGLLLLATRRPDRWGSIALGATALLAAVMTTFGALEPIVARTLRSAPMGLFGVAVVIVGVASVLLTLTLAVLSLFELAHRRRAAQPSSG